ncbi:MAG: hypothetical protein KC466_08325, partial [Myxococcales bacterium]|nr:hypothetical protein [Myxococcales bacterium]
MDFRTLRDVCLNVAGPNDEVQYYFNDREAPGALFSFALEQSIAENPPEGDSTFSSDGMLDVKVDARTAPGDYEVLVASETGSFDPLFIKVVDEPDYEPLPIEKRSFLMGMTPSVGRESLVFGQGEATSTFTPGLVSFTSAVGSSDLILLQILPEWGEPPYTQLEKFLKPTINQIRRTGRDVLLSFDTFGSRFRDQIAGFGLEELSGPCGGLPRFSCPLVRERFGDYAEAVAAALQPPYIVLGVEADLYFFWNPGDEYSVYFAQAFKEAAQRVRAVSPKTKLLVSVQYDGGILMFASLLSQFVPGADAAQSIEQRLRDVFEPLAPECDLLGITTFPELIRNFRVAM